MYERARLCMSMDLEHEGTRMGIGMGSGHLFVLYYCIASAIWLDIRMGLIRLEL